MSKNAPKGKIVIAQRLQATPLAAAVAGAFGLRYLVLEKRQLIRKGKPIASGYRAK